MHQKFAVPLFVCAALFSLFVVGCSGRPPVGEPPTDLGVVAGIVTKGAVKDSTVTVYRLDATGARGAIAGTTKTDEAGAFSIPVGTATGPFLVVATGGSFVDEATGVTVAVNSAELTALVPVFAVETHADVRVTPVSHLAAGLALRWVQSEQKTLQAASDEAWQHLNAHFGALDWRTVTPTDVTTATGATLDEKARAGLLLAALSMEARGIAEGAGLTPGGRANPLTLTQALYADVTADGFFDGVGSNGRLIVPADGTVTDAGPSAKSLDGNAIRLDLAQAIARFLSSDRNVTSISLSDVQQLVTAIAGNEDERIFRTSSGPADIEAPTITFTKPGVDNAGVRGVTAVEVHAVDGVRVESFTFTAPASLVSTVASPAADLKTSTLLANLDVSSLPDGPLLITARAVDGAGNVATVSRTVVVSNHGPTITINSPAEGATVTGIAAINATAVAQAGSVALLQLVSPPAGVGADTLPAADQLGAVWNSTQAPEGTTTLTFHAEDTLGGVADLSVTVNVDNVPFGTVSTTATLGAPVGGLAVRLVAIDDSTGLPILGRPGGSVLGQTAASSLTDPGTGAASFTLSQENYEGPVQLVAQGTAATYIDPSDENAATTVALPTSFTLTSYIKHYKTGDALNVPLTAWTTLADDATLAYAQGKNPNAADAGTLTDALNIVEPLFPAHLSRPTSWPLRTVFPVSLTTGTQSVRDVVYAALPDVALNQLARDIAADVGLTPGTGYSLPLLVASLRSDVSDGQFDGKNGSLQLVTGGVTPYSLDANTSRFKLAVGMDRFIRGPANKTGLTRQDMQTSGIYDNVSSDTSILYPSSASPIAFDNVPPTITWTVTYINGAVDGGAPYQFSPTQQLVAGIVHIEAQATDSTGVQSTSVEVSGSPLTPMVGSGPALFKANFDTRNQPTDVFAFTATSCDRLANCGSSTFTVTADNSAPNINVAHPTPPVFYSAPFDVEATSSDNYKLESFVLGAPSTVADLDDTDALLSHVYAPSTSWTFSPSVVDGDFPLAFTACDVVGNCTLVTSTPKIDKTPPTVAFSGMAPPQYVNTTNVTITVAAGDGAGAGVSRVFVKGQGPAVQASQQSNGTWTATVLLTGTTNNIEAWAEDAAIPTNSGQGITTANAQAQILLDQAAPAVTMTNSAGYYSEQGLNFARASDGKPVIPVQWQYASNVKVDTSVSTNTIYKASSRLSWGASTPTGAVLEGTNPRNIPWLQTQVAYTTGTEAPITLVRYRFSSTTSTNYGPWNTAIPAVRTGSGNLFYDLPIALESFPALATSYGTTSNQTRTYGWQVEATDAAGNVSTVTYWGRSLQLVPPPVAIIRDTGYESRNDPKSLYAYRVANQTWDDFYDTNNANFVSDPWVRSDRFTIWNPADVPVAIRLTTPSSDAVGKTVETWSMSDTKRAASPSTYSMDSRTYQVSQSWDTRQNSDLSACMTYPLPAAAQSPCGVNSISTGTGAHFIGDTGNFRCIGLPLTTSYTTSLNTLGYVTPLPTQSVAQYKAFASPVSAATGVESNLASTPTTTNSADNGAWLIPAATASSAGGVAVYKAHPRVARPTTIASSDFGNVPNPALTWQFHGSTNAYQTWQGDVWKATGNIGYYTCTAHSWDSTEQYDAWERWQTLSSAVTSITNSGVIFATSGVDASNTIVGGFITYDTQTRSINFTH